MLAGGLLWTMACDNTLGIEDVLGVWRAIRVNGSPVPGDVDLYEGPYTRVVAFAFDRVEFLVGGRCVRSTGMAGDTTEAVGCMYVLDLEQDRVGLGVEPPRVSLDIGGTTVPGVFDGLEMTLRWPNDSNPPNVIVYVQK